MEDNIIPTFTPTYEEFCDFPKYILEIEKSGAHLVGLAKIIPPKEWLHGCNYADIDQIHIPSPILQEVDGKSGYYQQTNVPKKGMSVKEFRELSETPRFKAPSHKSPQELEWKYWKNMSYFKPLYGADMLGTLFPPELNVWNVNHLPSILNIIPEKLGIEIAGVNSAYLYFGMWKASFAWHTEDMDLYSINYIHFGEPKTWYCVPPAHAHRLEGLAASFFPAQYELCRAFLRHKTTIISPALLKTHGIPFHRIVHYAGEFMITFPKAYHAGFNHGFNCAESTNFASERWIECGRKASLCRCFKDNVHIDMDSFLQAFYSKEDFRAPSQAQAGKSSKPNGSALRLQDNVAASLQEFSSFAENREMNIQASLASIPGSLSSSQRICCVCQKSGFISISEKSPPSDIQSPTSCLAHPCQANLQSFNSKPDAFCPKEAVSPSHPQISVDSNIETPGSTLAQNPPKSLLFVCATCRIAVHADCYGSDIISSAPVHAWKCAPCSQLGEHSARCQLCGFSSGALKPIQGRDAWCHVVCALWIPEMHVDLSYGSSSVQGIADIPKARWKLKCTICATHSQPPFGACIQCSHGKCVRSYHIVCALREKYHIAIDFGTFPAQTSLLSYCKYHNPGAPKRPRKTELVADFIDWNLPLQMSQMVYARWRDRKWYSARVGSSSCFSSADLESSSQKYLLEFDDQVQTTVHRENILTESEMELVRKSGQSLDVGIIEEVEEAVKDNFPTFTDSIMLRSKKIREN